MSQHANYKNAQSTHSTEVISIHSATCHFKSKRKSFSSTPGPVVRAVDGVSFSVDRGKCFAIVGESGSGKSTLARLIVGLLKPTTGKVVLEGVSLATLDANGLRRIRRKVQFVLQDPRASLDPRMTLFDTLAEALTVHGLRTDPTDRNARMHEVVSLVGLSAVHLSRYPHELSGGQRQRAAIARAVICEPEVLVLDEPVSALDVSVQAQIINLLMDLKERLGLTYVVITHDLALVEHMADAVGVMYLGRFVEQGPVQEVCANPRHPYTQSLMAIAAHGRLSGEPYLLPGTIPSALAIPSGCSFHTRCPRARVLAERLPETARVTPDGPVPRCCSEEEPAPIVAPSGVSIACCHFADDSSSA